MKPRLYLALGVLVLLGIFAGQNFTPLTVRFLVWSFEIPQALLIVSCGALGGALGWLIGVTGSRKAD